MEGQSDRVDFVRFIEESGIDAILTEAILELNDMPEKPDNATEWLRKFFRRDTPNRYDELENTDNLLKQEVIKKEWKLTALRVEVEKKLKLLHTLRLKTQMISGNIPESNQAVVDIDHYKDWPENCLWRIQPNPSFRTTCSAGKLFGIKDDTKIVADAQGKINLQEKEGSNDDSESEDDLKKFIKEKRESKLLKASQNEDGSTIGEESQKREKKKRKDKSPHNKRTKRQSGHSSHGMGTVHQSRFLSVIPSDEPSNDPAVIADDVIEEEKNINLPENEPELAVVSPEAQKQKNRKDIKTKTKSKFDSAKAVTKSKVTKKKIKQSGEMDDETLYTDPETTAVDELEEIIKSPLLDKDKADVNDTTLNKLSLSVPHTKDNYDLPKGFLEQYMENIPRSYWKTSFNITPQAFEQEAESATGSEDELELTKEFSSYHTFKTNKGSVGKWYQKQWNPQIISDSNWQHLYENRGVEDYYHVDFSDFADALAPSNVNKNEKLAEDKNETQPEHENEVMSANEENEKIQYENYNEKYRIKDSRKNVRKNFPGRNLYNN